MPSRDACDIELRVRSLRKRQVVGSLEAHVRQGAYWGIRTNVREYENAAALECPYIKTLALANINTRLKRLDGTTQQRLMNCGYAVADAAVRRYFDTALPRPKDLPFDGGVG